jgi:predicted DNA-binding protein (MmcQ/YjbR family)
MTLELLSAICRSLPAVTEDVKWGQNLCFLIAGKMFAVASLDPASPVKLAFRCAAERYVELIEQDGVIPAPYLARYHWVALERWDALRDDQIQDAIRASHSLVRARLPRKVREGLG